MNYLEHKKDIDQEIVVILDQAMIRLIDESVKLLTKNIDSTDCLNDFAFKFCNVKINMLELIYHPNMIRDMILNKKPTLQQVKEFDDNIGSIFNSSKRLK